MGVPTVVAVVIYRAIDEYFEIGMNWSIAALLLLWGILSAIAVEAHPLFSESNLFIEIEKE